MPRQRQRWESCITGTSGDRAEQRAPRPQRPSRRHLLRNAGNISPWASQQRESWGGQGRETGASRRGGSRPASPADSPVPADVAVAIAVTGVWKRRRILSSSPVLLTCHYCCFAAGAPRRAHSRPPRLQKEAEDAQPQENREESARPRRPLRPQPD